MIYKQKMFFIISALIVFGFLSISVISYSVARNAALDNLIQTELPLAQDNIYSEVQRDLLSPKIVSSVMANDTFVKQWIADGEADVSEITKYLSNIAEKYHAFTSFLVVESSKNFYTPKGFMRTVGSDEPRDVWFYRVRQNPQKIELNIDPSEAEGDQLTIFINVPILNEANQFIGAIGLGLNIDLLKTRLEQYRKKYGRTVFLIDHLGNILLHENEQLRGENIHNLVGLNTIAKDLLNVAEGNYQYTASSQEVILQSRYIEDINLTLVLSANVDDITQSASKLLLINLSICLFITIIILFLLIKTLRFYQSKLENLAWTDDLTSINNRQAFKEYYEKLEHSKAPTPAYLLLIDVDDFKLINDQQGHMAGDSVLQQLALEMLAQLGDKDVLARWGGEEFMVLLNEANPEKAKQFAAALCQCVAASDALAKFAGSPVTLSIGVNSVDWQAGLYSNIDAVDKFLYEAKKAGKNCVYSG